MARCAICRARATIDLDDQHLAADTEFSLGDPWHEDAKYDDDDIISKFKIVSALEENATNELIDAVFNLENSESFGTIIRILSDPPVNDEV